MCVCVVSSWFGVLLALVVSGQEIALLWLDTKCPFPEELNAAKERRVLLLRARRERVLAAIKESGTAPFDGNRRAKTWERPIDSFAVCPQTIAPI
jgi:hypothetical protein